MMRKLNKHSLLGVPIVLLQQRHHGVAQRARTLLSHRLRTSVMPGAAVAAGAASDASAASANASMAATASAALASTRPDARLSSELRSLGASLGILSRADGSAQWRQGSTVVLAGVYGPAVTGPAREEKIDRANVVVNFKAASGAASQCTTTCDASHMHTTQ
jgi:hypothetical protein